MLRTITAKIGLLVASALVIAAGALVVSSKFTVESEMMRYEKRMIANILKVTLLEIDKDYAAVLDFRRQTLKTRKAQLKNVSRAVRDGLNKFHNLQQQGVLSPEQAKEAALDYVRSIRFANNDYFFAYDMDFNCLAHPREEMEGTNIYNIQDDQGNYICHEIKRIAEDEGSGFTRLRFPRLGSDAWAPKLCYVFHFPQWNWVLGTGVYIDDVKRQVQKKSQAIMGELERTLSEINLVEGGGSIFIFNKTNAMITSPSQEILTALSGGDQDRHGELFRRLKERATHLQSLSGPGASEDLFRNFKTVTFQAPAPGTPEETREIVAFSIFYKPLDWYVVGQAPKEYILEPAEKMIYGQVVAAVAVLVLSVLAAFLLVRRILRPISRLMEIAQQIAAGDMQAAQASLATLSRDRRGFSLETERLHQSFVHMVKSLTGLTRQIKKSQYQVAASATEISASARQSSDTVQAQAESSRKANEASKRITSTAGDLSASMSQATAAAGETASLAETGRQSLHSMEEAMRAVHAASSSISDKLNAINDTTADIGAITTTITKISEQTNLLSLNAAIEAEKAGEYGRGFSVVAREIRRLSDQTAMAVLDIEKMVDNVRSAVSSGVMEVESFSNQVQSGADQVKELGGRLDQIIERVLELTPRFEEVNTGLAEQSEGADQISAIMDELAQASSSSAESLEEFKLAAEQLNEAVQGLQNQLEGFKLDE
jgi:methyl-accepting chemotaxis protein WspA